MSSVSIVIPHVSISKEFDEMLNKCIASLGSDYNELIIFRNNGIGYAKAFNEGFKEARGDYLAAVSNDAFLTEGSVRDLCLPEGVTFSSNAQFGCFFCMPRWVYEKTEGFDERYGLAYMEDNDFLLRLKDLGIPLFRIRKVKVDHIGGLTVRALSKEGDAINFARERFKERWGNRDPNEGLVWQEK